MPNIPAVPEQVNTAAKFSINSSKLVIVEGKDEEVCLSYWLKFWGISGIQVSPVGGKDKIAFVLKILSSLSGFSGVTHILVVRDADADPKGAFDSVCHHLEANGFARPRQSWTWMASTGKSPALCVAIMPDADQKGALEELALQTVEADGMLAKAVDFVQDAYETRKSGWNPEDETSVKPLIEEHRGKAVAQAYMLTRFADLRELGRAAQKNIWNPNHPALQPLRDLLQAM